MIEGVDFKILDAEILPDLQRPGGKPVFKVRIHSNHSQVVFSFDNRSGSWLTHKTDDNGRRKEPLTDVAQAMSGYIARHGSKLLPAVSDNPFIQVAYRPAAEPNFTNNPFLTGGTT
jgi:hypothetical protein